MIHLDINWQSLQPGLVWAYEIALLITILSIVIYILLENRDPQKTITWIIVIALLPFVGIIFYFMFGRNFRKEKIFSKKILADFEQIEKVKLKGSIDLFNTKIYDKSVFSNLGIIRLLQHNNKAHLTEYNNVTVLTNGSETFCSIIHEMNQAKDHIHLEYYIIEDDVIGNTIRELLIKKAKEGVTVRLIYDDIGSWDLTSKYIDSLKNAGVEVYSFMPVRFYRFAIKINYRNHRKIIVIDGKVGFVGGLNIADRYIYGDGDIKFWRDTHLKIEGEAVLSLQYVFLLDWYFVSDKFIHDDKYFPPTEITEHCLVQIAASGPDSDWASIMQTYFYAITTAKKYVYISSPYFMPNESIVTALKTVSLSGVDVKIILPSKSDSFISYWGSMSFIGELLEAGIQIYMYEKGFTHSKVIIVDDNLCSVGTANMDIRSFDQNFEVNAIVYNEEIAAVLKNNFNEDIMSCNIIDPLEFNKRPLKHKLKESVAKVFSPLW